MKSIQKAGICLFILSWALKVSAQFEELALGDTMPDLTFKTYNYSNKTLNIKDFKGYVIILDFWTTYCSTCISSFPKLDSIQKVLNNKVRIFTVADQDNVSSIIPSFWKSNKITKKVSLPILLDTNQILQKYFPRAGVPYVVWIDSAGTVRAFTSPSYVSIKNIESIMNKEHIDWAKSGVIRKDIDYSKSLLFSSPNSDDSSVIFYSALTKRREGDIPRSKTEIDTAKGFIRYSIVNSPIVVLYRSTLKETTLFTKPNNFILSVKDSSRFIYNEIQDDNETWVKNNCYSYEVKMPLSTTKAVLFENMRLDLNKFLGLNGRIERKIVSCLVLKEAKGGTSFAPKTNQIFRNLSTSSVAAYYSVSKLIDDLNLQAGYPPILGDTSLENRSDLSIDIQYSELNNLQEVKKRLRRYGLELVNDRREMEMFILSDQ